MVDEGVAGGSEARVFLVGAGEKASPPPSTATSVPETGGAEIFGSLGALAGRSGDLESVFLFLLTIVRQRGGAKTTEKLSARGDDSGKRKRRDVFLVRKVDYLETGQHSLSVSRSSCGEANDTIPGGRSLQGFGFMA